MIVPESNLIWLQVHWPFKRVSGVAGVPDDVVLSVLSGLDSSGTWKGSWAAFIAWWLFRRSSRLESNYQKASTRTSLSPKTTLKSLSFFRLSDASCGFCLKLLLGFQDTGTLGTSVFFFPSWHQPLDKAWLYAGCGRISLVQQNQPQSLLFFSAFSKRFSTTFTADRAFFLDLGRYGDKIARWNSYCLANSVNFLLTKSGPLSVTKASEIPCWLSCTLPNLMMAVDVIALKGLTST